MTISLEESIRQFLALANELQTRASDPLGAQLAHLMKHYCDTKIEEVDHDSEPDDVVDLLYESDQPLVFDEPLDIRDYTDSDMRFSEKQELCVVAQRRVILSLGNYLGGNQPSLAFSAFFSFGSSPEEIARMSMSEVYRYSQDKTPYETFVAHLQAQGVFSKTPVRTSFVVQEWG